MDRGLIFVILEGLRVGSIVAPAGRRLGAQNLLDGSALRGTVYQRLGNRRSLAPPGLLIGAGVLVSLPAVLDAAYQHAPRSARRNTGRLQPRQQIRASIIHQPRNQLDAIRTRLND